MNYKTFIINCANPQESEKELNSFLNSNRIICVQREFCPTPTPCWNFLVEYVETEKSDQRKAGNKKEKIDYMEVLSQEDFAIFSKLRELRKQIATAEHIPPYLVFTDAELAAIVTAHITKPEDLLKLNNVRQNKIEKYAPQIYSILKGSGIQNNEENEIPF